jgi:5'-nucleotidase
MGLYAIRRSYLTLTVALAMLAATLMVTDAGAVPPGETFSLTILHNNDGESDLLPEAGEGGAALFKGLVDARRAAATNSILVSSGDNFLAGPEWTAGTNSGIFYDALTLEAMGYDAIALGNHDFDFGPDLLNEFIDAYVAPPTYLSANLDLSAVPDLAAQDIVPSTTVTVNGEPVGIIGAVTPNLATISSPAPVTVLQDVAGIVQTEVDALTAAGVEIVILISHLQGIDEDLALAAELSGVDVMVAGGGDELLANPTDPLLSTDTPTDIFGPYPMIATDSGGNDVPVVTTSGSYGYLGELSVDFDENGDATSWSGMPIRVVAADGITPNATLVTTVEDPVQAALDELATNVIATSEVDLNGVRGDVRTMETNQGDLIADSFLWQASQLAPGLGVKTPQVAFANGGGIRNDSVIPAGDITELDTFDMLPFLNFLTVVEDVPSAQFKEILENAVSAVEFTDGRFAQVAGVNVVYDPTGTPMDIDVDGTVLQAGERIIGAVLDDGTAVVQGGHVVPGAAPVTIALVDFLARGGDQYPIRDLPFTLLGSTYQQTLSDYLAAPASEGGLGGVVGADQYPVGGESRTVALEPDLNDSALVGGVTADGQWLVPGAEAPFFFGNPSDIPFLGDWNGDGTETPGLFRPSTGFNHVRDSNDFGVADRSWFMGNPGDIPLVGDWDGDGVDTVGVYRPTEGKVYLRNTQTTGFADVEYFFGILGDSPFAGDFDGDGMDTVGLFRESTGLVYLRNEQTTGPAEVEFFFGNPGDRFIGGDWDGDGTDTVGVLRGDKFFGRNSNTLGVADFEFSVDDGLAPIVSAQAPAVG